VCGGVNKKDEIRQMYWIYFVLVYEKRTMKPIKIVLRRGQREEEGERQRR
jgi:hypothetical protein